MSRNYFTLIAFFLLFSIQGIAQGIEEQLIKLANAYPITFEKLEVDSLFTEKYLILIEQPLDHTKPDGKHFKQRVYLSHLDYGSPVVFITEGYDANYAANPKYVNELTRLLHANQICVEHRYFGSSVPDSLDWDYLTVTNAAADHHDVIELLKNIYTEKWVSTGISKGGQTAMYHLYFYPKDVDVSVPYVAPLNFSTEDKRVYKFLQNVSTEHCRSMVYGFQKELFQNKERYLKAFEKLASEKGLSFRVGIEKAYELTVLEYSFAFFQWGNFNCDSIPKDYANPDKIIIHLDQIAGINWISDKGIAELQPFFYQAMREIGFYGYDIKPFVPWTTFEENPTFEFTLPEGISVEYEPELMREVDCFIRHEAANMIFIYGEYDPWSATSVDLTLNTNSLKIVNPKGNHRTRIRNLNDQQKELVIETLINWLEE